MQNVSVYEAAYLLLSEGIKPREIARRLGKHRATIYRWKKTIRFRGIRQFVRDQEQAQRKRKRRCLSSTVVRLVKQSRDNHHDWCGEKIAWDLKKTYGIVISRSSVYRILHRYYTLRPGWKKNQVRGPQPVAHSPRDVIQADTVDFGNLFAYTAVDIYTREVSVVIGDNLTDEEGGRCIGKVCEHFGPCRVFQTDNGKEFATECHAVIRRYARQHRKIHAYRKNENAYIESFNRTLRKECLGWINYQPEDKEKLQALINDYLIFYNTQRPHLGLGLKIPAEVYLSHLP